MKPSFKQEVDLKPYLDQGIYGERLRKMLVDWVRDRIGDPQAKVSVRLIDVHKAVVIAR